MTPMLPVGASDLLELPTEAEYFRELVQMEKGTEALTGWSQMPREQRVCGEWLIARGGWMWFSTLTFRSSVPIERAQRDVQAYLNTLARELGDVHVEAALTIERTSAGTPHIHLLLKSLDAPGRPGHAAPLTERLLHSAWARADWSHGFSASRAYDPAKGAAFYIAKGMKRDLQLSRRRAQEPWTRQNSEGFVWSPSMIGCPRRIACKRSKAAGCRIERERQTAHP